MPKIVYLQLHVIQEACTLMVYKVYEYMQTCRKTFVLNLIPWPLFFSKFCFLLKIFGNLRMHFTWYTLLESAVEKLDNYLHHLSIISEVFYFYIFTFSNVATFCLKIKYQSWTFFIQITPYTIPNSPSHDYIFNTCARLF